MNKRKRYVEVEAVFNERGGIAPKAIIFDGVRFAIDKVSSAHRAAATKAGGCGYRYTISVRGKETQLWFEGPRWFVEEKSDDAPIEYDPIAPDDWMIAYHGAIID
ncbi:MAG: hypothetical protein RR505_05015 [Raoultibacter sp.]